MATRVTKAKMVKQITLVMEYTDKVQGSCVHFYPGSMAYDRMKKLLGWGGPESPRFNQPFPGVRVAIQGCTKYYVEKVWRYLTKKNQYGHSYYLTAVEYFSRDPETQLRLILKDTYGGPSLSYQDCEFVIYKWGDAPVSELVLARGRTLSEVVANYMAET